MSLKSVCFVMHGKNDSIFSEHFGKSTESPNHKYAVLRDKFREKGYEICTDEKLDPNLADVVIHKDYVKGRPIDPKKTFLIAMESTLICPQNFNPDVHRLYKGVFTWHDDFAGENGITKINYAFDMSIHSTALGRRANFCCMIAENKKSAGSGELYSRRIEIIRWFEKNDLAGFQLYGRGWDRLVFGGKFSRKLNRLRLPRTTLFRSNWAPYKNYEGEVGSKISVMNSYTFAFCLENVDGVSGYVTEKIIHCMQAGAIPIYLGAPNIAVYVPEDCFIDLGEFTSLHELVRFLTAMPEKEIIGYQQRILAFLQSNKARVFSSERNAEIIVGEIVESQRK